jgi:hypothetical protein
MCCFVSKSPNVCTTPCSQHKNNKSKSYTTAQASQKQKQQKQQKQVAGRSRSFLLLFCAAALF